MNLYETFGETTKLYIKGKLGTFTIIIDTEDAPKVRKHSWYIQQTKKSGYISVRGYVGRVDGKDLKYLLSRYLLNMNTTTSDVVDHINGNTLDNRKENLRIISHQANSQNIHKATKSSKSGELNVYYREKYNKWVVSIRHDGKTKHVGHFDTKEEAIKISREVKAMLHPYSPDARNLGINKDNTYAFLAEQNYNRNRSDNNSGVTGVTFDKVRNKWIAYLTQNKKVILRKRFDTLEAAIKAREDALESIGAA